MSTKTIYKRIALVAVASLGFGVLTSVSPASAAAAADDYNLVSRGSTLAATAVANGTGPDTAVARAGVNTIVLSEDLSVVAADAATFIVSTGSSAATAGANEIALSSPAYMDGGGSAATVAGDLGTIALNTSALNTELAIGNAVQVTPGAGTTANSISAIKFNATLVAGTTYYVYVDPSTGDDVATGGIKIGSIEVIDAGAPVTASYSQVGYVNVGTRANMTAKLSLKDSSNRSTILVGDETIGHASTRQTPASDVALDAINTTTAIYRSITAGVVTAYDVTIPGGGTNVPTVGSLYTITSTILKGASAFGSTTVTYRNVASTLGLTGSVAFIDATSKAVVTSIARATSGTFAGGTYGVVVKDSTGAVVVGVTPVATASAGTVSTAIGATDETGSNTAIAYSAAATAGTATISIALSTGSTSLTTSVSVVTTAYGATAATTSTVKSVVHANGSGVVMTSTAPDTSAWTSAINVTGFTVTLSGLEASKAAVVQLTTSGATSPTVNGTAVSTNIFPVASATGEITLALAVTAAANGNTLTVTVDPEGNAGAVTVLVITYATATNNITTAPTTGSLNMSTPSATKVITAAGTDQFKNPITGGSFKLTNTVVPAGATAATAVTVNQSAAGTATLNAVLGATLGTYTFTVELISVNAAVLATSTINYSVTTTGIAGSLTLTDTDNSTGELTTDDKGTRTIVIAEASQPSAALSTGSAITDTATAITVTTATPAGLAFTATATNGIRLFTSATGTNRISAGAASVEGTAGSSANLWAVPTKVGAGTITVVSGGITKVYTLTGTLGAAKTAFVTLAPTTTIGQYTVKATDLFGNGVASDVAISLTGPGSFSNGFKNLTVTTGTDGLNTFNVVSDGSASTTIKAVLAAGTYTVISAANAKTAGIVGLGTDGATTDTATVSMTGKGGTSELNSIMTTLAALNAKIVALNALIAKIMKRLNIR